MVILFQNLFFSAIQFSQKSLTNRKEQPHTFFEILQKRPGQLGLISL